MTSKPADGRGPGQPPVLVTWRGETRSWYDWAEHLGLDRDKGATTLRKRLRNGWDLDRVFKTPVRRWSSSTHRRDDDE